MGKIAVVDSGSTKSDWVVFDDKTEERFVSEGMNPRVRSLSELQDIGEKAIPERIAENVSEIHFYGTACSAKENIEKVQKALQSVFQNAGKVVVDHDLMGAARATCGSDRGITVILGTGSNSCSFDGNQIIDNVKSLGYYMGDEGSATHIAKLLVQGYFYREMPANEKKAFEAFTDTQSLIERVYASSKPNFELAKLAEFVPQQNGSEYVQDLVRKSFEEFVSRQLSHYKNFSSSVRSIGSVAFYNRKILSEVLNKYGFQLDKAVQKPIDELVKYHRNEANQ
jgi:N-acetylglucosamine kinase-like BadF-type ATPase